MPRWFHKEVKTDHGPRWVVENDAGEQQHGGWKYTDEQTAQRWADILNAFHKGWGMQKESNDGH